MSADREKLLREWRDRFGEAATRFHKPTGESKRDWLARRGYRPPSEKEKERQKRMGVTHANHYLNVPLHVPLPRGTHTEARRYWQPTPENYQQYNEFIQQRGGYLAARDDIPPWLGMATDQPQGGAGVESSDEPGGGYDGDPTAPPPPSSRSDDAPPRQTFPPRPPMYEGAPVEEPVVEEPIPRPLSREQQRMEAQREYEERQLKIWGFRPDFDTPSEADEAAREIALQPSGLRDYAFQSTSEEEPVAPAAPLSEWDLPDPRSEHSSDAPPRASSDEFVQRQAALEAAGQQIAGVIDRPDIRGSQGGLVEIVPNQINPTFDVLMSTGTPQLGRDTEPALAIRLNPPVGASMTYIRDASGLRDQEINGRKVLGRCGGGFMPTASEMIQEGIDPTEVAKKIPGYRQFQSQRNAAYNRLNNMAGEAMNALAWREAQQGALGNTPWRDNPLTRDAIGDLNKQIVSNRDTLSRIQAQKMGMIQPPPGMSMRGAIQAQNLSQQIATNRGDMFENRLNARLEGASVEQLIDMLSGGLYDMNPRQQLPKPEQRKIRQQLVKMMTRAEREKMSAAQRAAEGRQVLLPPRVTAVMRELQAKAAERRRQAQRPSAIDDDDSPTEAKEGGIVSAAEGGSVSKMSPAQQLPEVSPQQLEQIPLGAWAGVTPEMIEQMGIDLVSAPQAEQIRQTMAEEGTLRSGPGNPIGGEILKTRTQQRAAAERAFLSGDVEAEHAVEAEIVPAQGQSYANGRGAPGGGRLRQGMIADGSHPEGAPATGGAGFGSSTIDVGLESALSDLGRGISSLSSQIGQWMGQGEGMGSARTLADAAVDTSNVRHAAAQEGQGDFQTEMSRLYTQGAQRFIAQRHRSAAARRNAEGQHRGHEGLRDESQWIVGARFAQRHGMSGAVARGTGTGNGGSCPPGHVCWTDPNADGGAQTYELPLYSMSCDDRGCAPMGTAAVAQAQAQKNARMLWSKYAQDMSVGIHGDLNDPGIESGDDIARFIAGEVTPQGRLSHIGNYRQAEGRTAFLQGMLAGQRREDGSLPVMSRRQFERLAGKHAFERSHGTEAERERAGDLAAAQAGRDYEEYRTWWRDHAANIQVQDVPADARGVWVKTPRGTYEFAPRVDFGDTRSAWWRMVNPRRPSLEEYDEYGRCIGNCYAEGAEFQWGHGWAPAEFATTYTEAATGGVSPYDWSALTSSDGRNQWNVWNRYGWQGEATGGDGHDYGWIAPRPPPPPPPTPPRGPPPIYGTGPMPPAGGARWEPNIRP